MENRDETDVKRVEHLARMLTYAAAVLGITVVLLLILDFAPS